MRRYDRRLRRLTQRVDESLPARRQARLQQMSREDLMAEAARMSVALGMPEELAADEGAMLAWGTEYLGKIRETMTEEEWERITAGSVGDR